MLKEEIITAFGDAGSVVIIAALFVYLFAKFTKFTKDIMKEHKEERKEWRESDEFQKQKTRDVLDKLTDVIRDANSK
jgi:ATP-dependent protease HslVU (ClpYQ) peptidase subunit